MRVTETTIQGHPVRLLECLERDGVLIDTWDHLDEPEGAWRRVGAVVTFPVGYHWEPDGPLDLPDVPWSMAYDDHPSGDPVERFQEAIRQERERARERLGGPLHFEQAWPPADARTLVASVTEHDTRDGWVRVTWLASGEVVVQGAPAELVAQVPASHTERDVVAWARAHGFASVDLPRDPLSSQD